MTTLARPTHAAITAALLTMAVSGVACAQDASPAEPRQVPQATSATYRDWTMRCQTVDVESAGAREVCEIAQAIRGNGDERVLAQLVIGRPDPDGPVRMVVQLPPGVWLPVGVYLEPADGNAINADYTRCMQVCAAATTLEQSDIDALKAATDPASITFQDGARRQIELPVSLDGFTAALEASEAK